MVACKAFAAFSLEWLFYRPGRNPDGEASVYRKEVVGVNSIREIS